MINDQPVKMHTERGFWDTPRCRFWHTIWAELCEHHTLPQVDRWLAVKLKSDRRFGQKDRRWYSEATFRALRFGIWAVAAQLLVDNCKRHLELSCENVLRILEKPTKPSHWWALLRTLDSKDLIFWLRLRETDTLGLDDTQRDAAAVGRVWAFWNQIAKAELDGALECNTALLQVQMLWNGLPANLVSELDLRAKQSGWTRQQIAAFLQSQTTRAPLWVRLNDLRLKDKTIELLTANGLAVETCDPLGSHHEQSWSLKVEGTANLYQNEAYRSGKIEIQDKASQQIGEILKIKRGDYIWDACAGGGGKTIQAAARLKGSGAVYASDVRAYKLDEVKRRAKRAGFSNIRYLAWDGVNPPSLSGELKKKGGFDIILIDAPCSSSGTWRRNPDGRFRLEKQFLKELNDIQQGILDKVWPYLKQGGQIVYATCSWLVCENEAIVEAWLKYKPELELQSMQMIGTPSIDADAMFVASLVKT